MTSRPTAVVGLIGAVVFVATTAMAASTSTAPAAWEIDVFRAVNGLPDWLHVVVWPFMQYGVFVTIPIAAAVAAVLRRRRLAGMLLGAGVSVYLLAKIVKVVADRGRPIAYLDGVIEREQVAHGSLGYTSGHAAVAATIATISYFHLPTALRRLSIALVVIVPFGRMYVGAHLPLDLVGGVAMGVAAGCLVTLLDRAVRHD